jgi:methyl-accepting chemotaxis protein
MLEEKLSEVHYISEEAAAASEQVSASSEHQILAIEQVNEAALSLSDIATELQEEVSQFVVVDEAGEDEDAQSAYLDTIENYEEENVDKEQFERLQEEQKAYNEAAIGLVEKEHHSKK